MQKNFRYKLTEPVGRNFDPEFRPELTPKEMLAMGVFCGKYMTDCGDEFPKSWFIRAKLSPARRECSLNYFGVDASQPLSEWLKAGGPTLHSRRRIQPMEVSEAALGAVPQREVPAQMGSVVG
jgi:hypothetical protein